jgi:hypothetical protein
VFNQYAISSESSVKEQTVTTDLFKLFFGGKEFIIINRRFVTTGDYGRQGGAVPFILALT